MQQRGRRTKPVWNDLRAWIFVGPRLRAVGPEVSFAVALVGRLAIKRIAKPEIQKKRIRHSLFREDRGLLQMMIVFGAADKESDRHRGRRCVQAGIVRISAGIVFAAWIHADRVHRVDICRQRRSCASSEN